MVGRGSGLVRKGILGISHVVRNQVECSLKASSHQANAKAKKIKEQSVEIKEKFQTSKKMFAFARCE